MGRYQPVEPNVSLPELELRVLEFWREARIFEKSLKLREGAPEWVFYEGPPTANGKPGIHHVEARTFKDVYPRFKTMTGHSVPRKGGWDCHGLPVELEVEKEIGTTTKRDIEEFGIAKFNRRCRESVTRYVDDWARMTERIGFWIDLSDAYLTMSNEYVESVWWSLKELHLKGLLFEADKSVAYCPRCGTALSDHEVALGYTQVVDPSVYVRFRVTAGVPEVAGASIAAWTTTPWTLPSNLGLAVDREATYVTVERGGERLVVAEAVRGKVLGEDGRIVATYPGSTLVGATYESLYENVDGNTHRVVAADFVSLDEGTGVVHIAPGFGEEDLELGRREGWPTYKPVDDAGRFTDEAPAFVRGEFVKDADPAIIEDLRDRGLLISAGDYEHTYPLCWRCETPLLYIARTSWYVRTTARKDRLLEVNESVNWYPDHIKHGRYGDWLDNNVDWALSRDRYWGTPLPIWRCSDDHITAVGSLKELSELAGRDVTGIDPHRPAVDEVEFGCPECGETARRVPQVIDAWYDSGAMPYAQWGYHPELDRGQEVFGKRFPADFIAEGIDQTRGWFYSLMAEATLLFDDTSYRNCVVLGLLVDKEGRKMSKRLGNVMEPSAAIDRYGADAVRWFFIAKGSPWDTRRVSFESFEEVVRQFFLTLWNVYAFFVTYANVDGFDPDDARGISASVDEPPPLDRWILSQLAETVDEARRGFEGYNATSAGRRIARFVDDLSNWYVRRARRRFWDTGRGAAARDKAAAYLTLHECLVTVAQLIAPIAPFIAEELWRNLAMGRAGFPESVHLSDYPASRSEMRDAELDEAMRAARDIVSLGREARTNAKVRVRQPLRRAVVHMPGEPARLEPLLTLVTAELNVKEVAFAERAEELGRWHAKPNFRVLGPKLGPRVKGLASLLQLDDGTTAGRLARGEMVTATLPDGFAVEIGPGDVDLTQETKEGWGVAGEGGVTVALDLDVTPELAREGMAREVVHLVQGIRKAAGLEVADRIALGLQAAAELAAAVTEHRDYIAAETLAFRVEDRRIDDPLREESAEIGGQAVTISLRKA